MIQTMFAYCKACAYMLVVCVVLLASCSDGYTFTSYPCHVVIDNSIHQDATLATSMNAASPGVFCTVSVDEARRQYRFTNNAGLISACPFTAVDLRMTRDVGMNGAVIVGYGTLTSVFYAYDRECPACFSPDALPVRSRPLTVSGTGVAECPVCHRRYDLNTGGNCTSEGGAAGMTRYRASTTGPYGTLAVGN